jgi:2-oxoglutarate dehydrogenase E1 component
MIPVFHVHGENPEALIQVTRLACDYRMTLGKDVVIDLVCYRRHGHNEGDEPYYTQPQMYDRIKERPPIYRLYGNQLLEEGTISKDEIDTMQAQIRMELEEGHRGAQREDCPLPEEIPFEGWEEFDEDYSHEPVETGVPTERLVSLTKKLHTYPQDFKINPKLHRILQKRVDIVEKGQGIDWGHAEALSFASLLVEGIPVRLSGEDSRRGTFSHRHSVLTDPNTGERYTPLNHLEENQALFLVYDSHLSEYGVLGFEYGYSLANPKGLTIWEAQFGDFANGAQIVIDQYIVAAEVKWRRQSGLVLLLPHGYEGMGPEHSSARLERFLQLCAEDNIQVCNPTTPAQCFHLLRRQVKRNFRKPLIIMSPKSLLRHPLAVSNLEDLATGRFHEVLDDVAAINAPRRVALCTGKIYYDLLRKREELQRKDVALIRLEQIHPFPEEQFKGQFDRYVSEVQWVWVQEEPENMGAWCFVQSRLEALLGQEVGYIGRKASASPAAGLLITHKQEQTALCDAVFDFEGAEVSRRV